MIKINRFYIYVWIRLDKNEVFYVGKGSNNRYKDMSMRNKYFLNVVNKIGMDNIEIKIIEDNLTEDEAFEKEILYIEYYKNNENHLTNMTKGGEGSSNWYEFLSEEEKERHREKSRSFVGRTHSEKTKRKMSESAKGRKWDEEHKKMFSEKAKGRSGYWKGKKLSEETRRKLSESKKGSKMSEETKEKISKTLKGRKGTTNKIVYILISNEIKYIYDSKKECIKNRPNNISMYFIEKSLKKYKTYNGSLGEDMIIIYKEDYDRLETQSTIESIAQEKDLCE